MCARRKHVFFERSERGLFRWNETENRAATRSEGAVNVPLALPGLQSSNKRALPGSDRSVTGRGPDWITVTCRVVA